MLWVTDDHNKQTGANAATVVATVAVIVAATSVFTA